MRLLLDECVVRDLKRDLVGHDVSTVVEAVYGGLQNGDLLRAASGRFDVLITVDQILPYQQNIGAHQIAILILKVGGITYSSLKPLVPEILNILQIVQPGELKMVEGTPKT